MNTTQFKRLEKLTVHLETGQLGHKVFDFSAFNQTNGYYTSYKCGTNGCAGGECPVIFKSWHFNDIGLPNWDGVNRKLPRIFSASAIAFFGITEIETYHLFLPNCQDNDIAGYDSLSKKSSRQRVARHFRMFIESKRKIIYQT